MAAGTSRGLPGALDLAEGGPVAREPAPGCVPLDEASSGTALASGLAAGNGAPCSVRCVVGSEGVENCLRLDIPSAGNTGGRSLPSHDRTAVGTHLSLRSDPLPGCRDRCVEIVKTHDVDGPTVRREQRDLEQYLMIVSVATGKFSNPLLSVLHHT